MKSIIILLTAFFSVYAHAFIEVEYGTAIVQQVASGKPPNDQLTSQIKPNVSIVTTSDKPGIYSVVGVDIQCEGSFFVQKEQIKEGTNNTRFSLGLSSIDITGYADWQAQGITEKRCVMVWTAESIGTKTTSGTSISFSVGGTGSGISISTSSNIDPPDNVKGKTSTSEFKMMIEKSTGSGSNGSTC